MKIGYPCMNRSIGCTSSSTFRLKSYSKDLVVSKADNNLNCLYRILKYNLEKGILFFRISSDLIPFASHSICKVSWKQIFKNQFKKIGNFIKDNHIRISMHPDQFTLINSIKYDIFTRSLAELKYHADVLDLLNLDNSAKIQIHAGGVYANKDKSIKRFIQRYKRLPKTIKMRLVIENDEKSYTVKDCLVINQATNIPILFDFYHHQLKNKGEKLKDVFAKVARTWEKKDGLPMVDYSSIHQSLKKGRHAESINLRDFKVFLQRSKPYDFDLMLEIKDKEKSAEKAVKAASGDYRLLKLK